jgi:hypothetical protein
MRNRVVPVAGRGKVPIGKLVDRALARHRRTAAELRKARRALLAAPVDTDEVIETEEATIISMTTSMTVVDPVGLRASVPTLKGYGGAAGSAPAVLPPAARAGFTTFKTGLRTRPANDPLRVAAEQGDDALLTAIAAGQGELAITTTVAIPKSSLTRTGTTLSVPTVSDGAFDYSALSNLPLFNHGIVTPQSVDLVPPPETSGSITTASKFLTGFTIDDSFEWEEEWEFPSGSFNISAGAWYAFGLRIPIEVTATVTPTMITNSGSMDQTTPFTTTLNAKTLDGGTSFYRDTGLPESQIYDGKELVIEAGAYVTLRLTAGWGAIKINETIPKNLRADYGKHFKPPLGDCGTGCGFDVWIPAAITHTEFNVLGMIEGSAQVGFNVSGDGTVAVGYESLFNGSRLDSSVGGTTRGNHTMSFTKAGNKTVSTILPVATRSLLKDSFGYRLFDPVYTWKIQLTPGIKGAVVVNAKPFFKLDVPIGPFWLNFLEIDLGSITLRSHQGTNTSYSNQPGRKSYKSPNVLTRPE